LVQDKWQQATDSGRISGQGCGIHEALASFPQTSAADQFREHARKSLGKEIAKVLAGENKDVEKRYKYYVEYS
jgi:hypothetical protein